ncbi:MAG: monovalent cation/H+ antiporter subunit D family protein, partial [Gammaproteobacteria bacterium]|nr:monovalent cation/H+ antiporter subunit D family protein [Gammaproteobacteria bacterium]MBU1831827.1 monovalent cation/H+ antiporter subunit D family protein [Gammaproteobacteria bacterium]
AGHWPLVFLILLGSLLAIVYIWRVVEALYFKSAADNSPVKEAPLTMLIALWLLILGNVYFGIDTRLPISISYEAAAALVEGRP